MVLLHGVPWVHVAPALLALVFAFLYLKTKQFYLKLLFGFLWLILIPNTAYIFTDIWRMRLHWYSADLGVRSAFIIQYILLETVGLVTFLLSMLPLESMIHRWNFSKNKQIIMIVFFNFLIGFGMVLGRTGYTNSYVLFTQPTKVFFAASNIVTSLYLLGLTVVFGIICNCIYFLYRNRLLRYAEIQKASIKNLLFRLL